MHTPGKWTVRPYGDSFAIFEGEIRIAYCYGAFSNFSIEETKDHARLIAEAPAMLAKLSEWVDAERDAHFEEQAHDPEGCRYCESFAIIARAEGKQ